MPVSSSYCVLCEVQAPNPQAPNTRQVPNPNTFGQKLLRSVGLLCLIQPDGGRNWNLVLGASLVLGFWSLGLWNLEFFWDLGVGIWDLSPTHVPVGLNPL